MKGFNMVVRLLLAIAWILGALLVKSYIPQTGHFLVYLALTGVGVALVSAVLIWLAEVFLKMRGMNYFVATATAIYVAASILANVEGYEPSQATTLALLFAGLSALGIYKIEKL